MPEIQRVYGLQLRTSSFTGRLVFGLIVLALGVLWTLDNLGVIDSAPILRWWPILLMLAGLARLTGIGARQQMVSGAVLTIAGFLLLGDALHLIHVRIWQLWPIAMIVIGTGLVVRSMRPALPPGSSSDAQAELHLFTMMGGVVQKNVSQQFRGGDLSAVMGGIQIDLRGATPAGPEIPLDVFAWWGGIDLTVPPDWRVVTQVTPIMAGYDDRTKPISGQPRTTLIIRGLVIMGGVEIKN
jgi:predicted membrane protein